MAAILSLFKAIVAASSDDIDLVTHITLQSIAKVDRAWHAVDKRNHVYRETRLQGREFEQVVHYNIRVGVAFECDNQICLTARRIVIDIGNAVKITTVYKFLNSCSNRRATRLIRQFSDNNSHLATHAIFDCNFCPHLDAATTCFVGLVDATAPQNQAARRKIWSFDELHQVGNRRLRVVD